MATRHAPFHGTPAKVSGWVMKDAMSSVALLAIFIPSVFSVFNRACHLVQLIYSFRGQKRKNGRAILVFSDIPSKEGIRKEKKKEKGPRIACAHLFIFVFRYNCFCRPNKLA